MFTHTSASNLAIQSGLLQLSCCSMTPGHSKVCGDAGYVSIYLSRVGGQLWLIGLDVLLPDLEAHVYMAGNQP